MAIKHIIVLFVETPRKFITAKLSIRKPGSSSVLIICLNILLALMKIRVVRIESFAVINLRGVSTNKTSNQYITIYTLYNEANSVSMSQN